LRYIQARSEDVRFYIYCFFFSIPQFRRPSSAAAESSSGKEGKLWVVIVAGSKHWWDYEIQVILEGNQKAMQTL
jgi:hypothetical protein